MLAELSIENFAIIDRLLVRFDPGLTVLTGETGAGKSIIIDALQAVLGARVPADVVRADTRYGAVEAVFVLNADTRLMLEPLLAEYGIDQDDTLILRREIHPGGRGSSRLNGRAVPVAALAAAGSLLVDIHGQSEHLSILRRDRQLDALDRYAGLQSLRAETTAAISRYLALQKEFEALTGNRRASEQRLDLLRFQVTEIEGAALAAGEEEELTAERARLFNAERLTQLAGDAYALLQGDREPALERLDDALRSVTELSGIDEHLAPLLTRLESARYEVEDIAQEVRRYRDAVEIDPARLDVIEERLDTLQRLRRKYGATIEEVIEFGSHARAELDAGENLDDRLARLETAVRDAAIQAGALAARLSDARCASAAEMNDAMVGALADLGLGGTTFSVSLDRRPGSEGLPLPDGETYSFSAAGVDTVSFLVSFNRGEPLRPMEKVASGGETSRFLLALKGVLAQTDGTPTLVFDEVDVGVGARNGMVVGERLRRLSRDHQVLSITHLPQVAATADHHLVVFKSVAGDRTVAGVKQLDSSDRASELAAMMYGYVNDSNRRNAEELLQTARRS